MELKSRKGMVVQMTAQQWAEIELHHRERAREYVLTRAARALEHRARLEWAKGYIMTQAQKADVLRLAKDIAFKDAVYGRIIEKGYESYVLRAVSGLVMPDSWGRIYADAAAEVRGDMPSRVPQDTPDEIKSQIERLVEAREAAFIDGIEVKQEHIDEAKDVLGIPTQRDIEYSERFARCPWEITPAAMEGAQ